MSSWTEQDCEIGKHISSSQINMKQQLLPASHRRHNLQICQHGLLIGQGMTKSNVGIAHRCWGMLCSVSSSLYLDADDSLCKSEGHSGGTSSSARHSRVLRVFLETDACLIIIFNSSIRQHVYLLGFSLMALHMAVWHVGQSDLAMA